MLLATQIRVRHSEHPQNGASTHGLILLPSLAAQGGNPLMTIRVYKVGHGPLLLPAAKPVPAQTLPGNLSRWELAEREGSASSQATARGPSSYPP